MKAQVRNVEELSPDVLCCDNVRRCAAETAGKVVEVFGPPMWLETACRCGHTYWCMNYRVVGEKFHWVGVDTVWIEEGAAC